jgi:hypothetical protein
MGRIRTIRPEFWSDETIADLDDLSKLVYIGTWNLADDSGFFSWSVRGIAAELFRFERPERREKKVARALEALEALGRIRVLACGKHAIVPRFERHQRLAGTTRQVRTIERAHAGECMVPDDPRESPTIPDGKRDVEESRGKESREEVTRARAGSGEPNGRLSQAQEAELRELLANPKTTAAAKKAAIRTLERYGLEIEGENDAGK